MLRTIYAYITIFLFIVFGGTLLLILACVQPSGRSAYRIALAWAKWCVHACGIKLKTDIEGLDPKQRYIFVANHQSQVDIPILIALLSQFQIAYLAKHTLFTIPIFGRAMYALGYVPIDRSNPRKAFKALIQAVKQDQHSRSFLLFPEGTRNNELGPFKTGAVIMALKSGLPIVPLVINGSGKIMPKGSWRITPGKVSVSSLPPLEFQGNSALKQRDELTQKLWNLMNNKLLESSHE